MTKDIDECGKAERGSQYMRSQKQETKICLYENDEWKPPVLNVGSVPVNSHTEVGQPALQVHDGEMCPNSWATTEAQSPHQQ